MTYIIIRVRVEKDILTENAKCKMQNAVTHILIFVFLISIQLMSYLCCGYKLGDAILNNRNLSYAVVTTYRKINKYITNENTKYDTCIYKKVPNILIENKKEKNEKKRKYIVGIENTCDDTCICVIDTDLNILINVIISHFKIVDIYSGVYPFFISSINKLFLKQYADAILGKINTDNIICYGMSVCPGISKNMEAAKQYIKERSQNNIKISAVNHLYAHILSPLFFPFYNDNNTFTNCSEYKEKDSGEIENKHTINIDVSNTINNDGLLYKKEIHKILEIINNNDTTKKVIKSLTEKDFYKVASYTLRKYNTHERRHEAGLGLGPGLQLEKEKTKLNHEKKELLETYKPGYLKDGYICVLVSGGSTEIYKVGRQGKTEISVHKIAETVDISIGDVIDKLSRTLLLPVGVGGGYFLEKKSEEFVKKLKKYNMNAEDCEDPFQPFPHPFPSNNVINFSFSGIFNHMRKILEKLKREENFEEEKDRYAYFCQKNIFSHLLKQLNKIMYFSELHFNVKNICIVGGVGCNQFLYRSLESMAKSRNTEEHQMKEYSRLKKRLKKKIKKIEKLEIDTLANVQLYAQTDLQQEKTNPIKSKEIALTSLSWKLYWKHLLKTKNKEDVFSALNSFNFEKFMKLKREGKFFLNDLASSNSSEEWKVYKTPSNLSRDNAAMVCFNSFLNLWNNTNVYTDFSSIEIKQTVNALLENQFLFFSDIIVLDVLLQQQQQLQ